MSKESYVDQWGTLECCLNCGFHESPDEYDPSDVDEFCSLHQMRVSPLGVCDNYFYDSPGKGEV